MSGSKVVTSALRRRRWILLVLAVCTGKLLLTPAPIWAQTSPRQLHVPPRELWKDCPPGKRIEFLVGGTTSVYADPQWLSGDPPITEFPQQNTGCPTGPLKVEELFFLMPKRPTTKGGLQTDVLMLNAANRPARRTEDTSATTSPWVENRTPTYLHPDARLYRLLYPASEKSADNLVDVMCGGLAHLRNCSNTAYVYDGLIVSYKLMQPNLPIPDRNEAASGDPSTESGALLQLDQQLRFWVSGLRIN